MTDSTEAIGLIDGNRVQSYLPVSAKMRLHEADQQLPG